MSSRKPTNPATDEIPPLPSDNPAPSTPIVPKKMGRPKGSTNKNAHLSLAENIIPEGRRRSRAPKMDDVSNLIPVPLMEDDEDLLEDSPVKRHRGRPRKQKDTAPAPAPISSRASSQARAGSSAHALSQPSLQGPFGVGVHGSYAAPHTAAVQYLSSPHFPAFPASALGYTAAAPHTVPHTPLSALPALPTLPQSSPSSLAAPMYAPAPQLAPLAIAASPHVPATSSSYPPRPSSLSSSPRTGAAVSSMPMHAHARGPHTPLPFPTAASTSTSGSGGSAGAIHSQGLPSAPSPAPALALQPFGTHAHTEQAAYAAATGYGHDGAPGPTVGVGTDMDAGGGAGVEGEIIPPLQPSHASPTSPRPSAPPPSRSHAHARPSASPRASAASRASAAHTATPSRARPHTPMERDISAPTPTPTLPPAVPTSSSYSTPPAPAPCSHATVPLASAVSDHALGVARGVWGAPLTRGRDDRGKGRREKFGMGYHAAMIASYLAITGTARVAHIRRDLLLAYSHDLAREHVHCCLPPFSAPNGNDTAVIAAGTSASAAASTTASAIADSGVGASAAAGPMSLAAACAVDPRTSVTPAPALPSSIPTPFLLAAVASQALRDSGAPAAISAGLQPDAAPGALSRASRPDGWPAAISAGEFIAPALALAHVGLGDRVSCVQPLDSHMQDMYRDSAWPQRVRDELQKQDIQSRSSAVAADGGVAAPHAMATPSTQLQEPAQHLQPQQQQQMHQHRAQATLTVVHGPESHVRGAVLPCSGTVSAEEAQNAKRRFYDAITILCASELAAKGSNGLLVWSDHSTHPPIAASTTAASASDVAGGTAASALPTGITGGTTDSIGASATDVSGVSGEAGERLDALLAAELPTGVSTWLRRHLDTTARGLHGDSAMQTSAGERGAVRHAGGRGTQQRRAATHPHSHLVLSAPASASDSATPSPQPPLPPLPAAFAKASLCARVWARLCLEAPRSSHYAQGLPGSLSAATVERVLAEEQHRDQGRDQGRDQEREQLTTASTAAQAVSVAGQANKSDTQSLLHAIAAVDASLAMPAPPTSRVVLGCAGVGVGDTLLALPPPWADLAAGETAEQDVGSGSGLDSGSSSITCSSFSGPVPTAAAMARATISRSMRPPSPSRSPLPVYSPLPAALVPYAPVPWSLLQLYHTLNSDPRTDTSTHAAADTLVAPGIESDAPVESPHVTASAAASASVEAAAAAQPQPRAQDPSIASTRDHHAHGISAGAHANAPSPLPPSGSARSPSHTLPRRSRPPLPPRYLATVAPLIPPPFRAPRAGAHVDVPPSAHLLPAPRRSRAAACYQALVCAAQRVTAARMHTYLSLCVSVGVRVCVQRRMLEVLLAAVALGKAMDAAQHQDAGSDHALVRRNVPATLLPSAASVLTTHSQRTAAASDLLPAAPPPSTSTLSAAPQQAFPSSSPLSSSSSASPVRVRARRLVASRAFAVVDGVPLSHTQFRTWLSAVHSIRGVPSVAALHSVAQGPASDTPSISTSPPVDTPQPRCSCLWCLLPATLRVPATPTVTAVTVPVAARRRVGARHTRVKPTGFTEALPTSTSTSPLSAASTAGDTAERLSKRRRISAAPHSRLASNRSAAPLDSVKLEGTRGHPHTATHSTLPSASPLHDPSSRNDIPLGLSSVPPSAQPTPPRSAAQSPGSPGNACDLQPTQAITATQPLSTVDATTSPLRPARTVAALSQPLHGDFDYGYRRGHRHGVAHASQDAAYDTYVADYGTAAQDMLPASQDMLFSTQDLLPATQELLPDSQELESCELEEPTQPLDDLPLSAADDYSAPAGRSRGGQALHSDAKALEARETLLSASTASDDITAATQQTEGMRPSYAVSSHYAATVSPRKRARAATDHPPVGASLAHLSQISECTSVSATANVPFPSNVPATISTFTTPTHPSLHAQARAQPSFALSSLETGHLTSARSLYPRPSRDDVTAMLSAAAGHQSSFPHASAAEASGAEAAVGGAFALKHNRSELACWRIVPPMSSQAASPPLGAQPVSVSVPGEMEEPLAVGAADAGLDVGMGVGAVEVAVAGAGVHAGEARLGDTSATLAPTTGAPSASPALPSAFTTSSTPAPGAAASSTSPAPLRAAPQLAPPSLASVLVPPAHLAPQQLILLLRAALVAAQDSTRPLAVVPLDPRATTNTTPATTAPARVPSCHCSYSRARARALAAIPHAYCSRCGVSVAGAWCAVPLTHLADATAPTPAAASTTTHSPRGARVSRGHRARVSQRVRRPDPLAVLFRDPYLDHSYPHPTTSSPPASSSSPPPTPAIPTRASAFAEIGHQAIVAAATNASMAILNTVTAVAAAATRTADDSAPANPANGGVATSHPTSTSASSAQELVWGTVTSTEALQWISAALLLPRTRTNTNRSDGDEEEEEEEDADKPKSSRKKTAVQRNAASTSPTAPADPFAPVPLADSLLTPLPWCVEAAARLLAPRLPAAPLQSLMAGVPAAVINVRVRGCGPPPARKTIPSIVVKQEQDAQSAVAARVRRAGVGLKEEEPAMYTAHGGVKVEVDAINGVADARVGSGVGAAATHHHLRTTNTSTSAAAAPARATLASTACPSAPHTSTPAMSPPPPSPLQPLVEDAGDCGLVGMLLGLYVETVPLRTFARDGATASSSVHTAAPAVDGANVGAGVGAGASAGSQVSQDRLFWQLTTRSSPSSLFLALLSRISSEHLRGLSFPLYVPVPRLPHAWDHRWARGQLQTQVRRMRRIAGDSSASITTDLTDTAKVFSTMQDGSAQPRAAAPSGPDASPITGMGLVLPSAQLPRTASMSLAQSRATHSDTPQVGSALDVSSSGVKTEADAGNVDASTHTTTPADAHTPSSVSVSHTAATPSPPSPAQYLHWSSLARKDPLRAFICYTVATVPVPTPVPVPASRATPATATDNAAAASRTAGASSTRARVCRRMLCERWDTDAIVALLRAVSLHQPPAAQPARMPLHQHTCFPLLRAQHAHTDAITATATTAAASDAGGVIAAEEPTGSSTTRPAPSIPLAALLPGAVLAFTTRGAPPTPTSSSAAAASITATAARGKAAGAAAGLAAASAASAAAQEEASLLDGKEAEEAGEHGPCEEDEEDEDEDILPLPFMNVALRPLRVPLAERLLALRPTRAPPSLPGSQVVPTAETRASSSTAAGAAAPASKNVVSTGSAPARATRTTTKTVSTTSPAPRALSSSTSSSVPASSSPSCPSATQLLLASLEQYTPSYLLTCRAQLLLAHLQRCASRLLHSVARDRLTNTTNITSTASVATNSAPATAAVAAATTDTAAGPPHLVLSYASQRERARLTAGFAAMLQLLSSPLAQHANPGVLRRCLDTARATVAATLHAIRARTSAPPALADASRLALALRTCSLQLAPPSLHAAPLCEATTALNEAAHLWLAGVRDAAGNMLPSSSVEAAVAQSSCEGLLRAAEATAIAAGLHTHSTVAPSATIVEHGAPAPTTASDLAPAFSPSLLDVLLAAHASLWQTAPAALTACRRLPVVRERARAWAQVAAAVTQRPAAPAAVSATAAGSAAPRSTQKVSRRGAARAARDAASAAFAASSATSSTSVSVSSPAPAAPASSASAATATSTSSSTSEDTATLSALARSDTFPSPLPISESRPRFLARRRHDATGLASSLSLSLAAFGQHAAFEHIASPPTDEIAPHGLLSNLVDSALASAAQGAAAGTIPSSRASVPSSFATFTATASSTASHAYPHAQGQGQGPTQAGILDTFPLASLSSTLTPSAHSSFSLSPPSALAPSSLASTALQPSTLGASGLVLSQSSLTGLSHSHSLMHGHGHAPGSSRVAHTPSAVTALFGPSQSIYMSAASHTNATTATTTSTSVGLAGIALGTGASAGMGTGQQAPLGLGGFPLSSPLASPIPSALATHAAAPGLSGQGYPFSSAASRTRAPHTTAAHSMSTAAAGLSSMARVLSGQIVGMPSAGFQSLSGGLRQTSSVFPSPPSATMARTRRTATITTSAFSPPSTTTSTTGPGAGAGVGTAPATPALTSILLPGPLSRAPSLRLTDATHARPTPSSSPLAGIAVPATSPQLPPLAQPAGASSSSTSSSGSTSTSSFSSQ